MQHLSEHWQTMKRTQFANETSAQPALYHTGDEDIVTIAKTAFEPTFLVCCVLQQNLQTVSYGTFFGFGSVTPQGMSKGMLNTSANVKVIWVRDVQKVRVNSWNSPQPWIIDLRPRIYCETKKKNTDMRDAYNRQTLFRSCLIMSGAVRLRNVQRYHKGRGGHRIAHKCVIGALMFAPSFFLLLKPFLSGKIASETLVDDNRPSFLTCDGSSDSSHIISVCLPQSILRSDERHILEQKCLSPSNFLQSIYHLCSRLCVKAPASPIQQFSRLAAVKLLIKFTCPWYPPWMGHQTEIDVVIGNTSFLYYLYKKGWRKEDCSEVSFLFESNQT